jgi:hypothetical protein
MDDELQAAEAAVETCRANLAAAQAKHRGEDRFPGLTNQVIQVRARELREAEARLAALRTS